MKVVYTPARCGTSTKLPIGSPSIIQPSPLPSQPNPQRDCARRALAAKPRAAQPNGPACKWCQSDNIRTKYFMELRRRLSKSSTPITRRANLGMSSRNRGSRLARGSIIGGTRPLPGHSTDKRLLIMRARERQLSRSPGRMLPNIRKIQERDMDVALMKKEQVAFTKKGTATMAARHVEGD